MTPETLADRLFNKIIEIINDNDSFYTNLGFTSKIKENNDGTHIFSIFFTKDQIKYTITSGLKDKERYFQISKNNDIPNEKFEEIIKLINGVNSYNKTKDIQQVIG